MKEREGRHQRTEKENETSREIWTVEDGELNIARGVEH